MANKPSSSSAGDMSFRVELPSFLDDIRLALDKLR